MSRAEGLRRIVEDDGEMRRLFILAPFSGDRPLLQHLPDHVAEAGDRADRQIVGLARQRRQRVEGAEDEAGAVDQDQMVAGLDRRLGDGRAGGFGHGGHFARHGRQFKPHRGIATAARARLSAAHRNASSLVASRMEAPMHRWSRATTAERRHRCDVAPRRSGALRRRASSIALIEDARRLTLWPSRTAATPG